MIRRVFFWGGGYWVPKQKGTWCEPSSARANFWHHDHRAKCTTMWHPRNTTTRSSELHRVTEAKRSTAIFEPLNSAEGVKYFLTRQLEWEEQIWTASERTCPPVSSDKGCWVGVGCWWERATGSICTIWERGTVWGGAVHTGKKRH